MCGRGRASSHSSRAPAPCRILSSGYPGNAGSVGSPDTNTARRLHRPHHRPRLRWSLADEVRRPETLRMMDAGIRRGDRDDRLLREGSATQLRAVSATRSRRERRHSHIATCSSDSGYLIKFLPGCPTRSRLTRLTAPREASPRRPRPRGPASGRRRCDALLRTASPDSPPIAGDVTLLGALFESLVTLSVRAAAAAR